MDASSLLILLLTFMTAGPSVGDEIDKIFLQASLKEIQNIAIGNQTIPEDVFNYADYILIEKMQALSKIAFNLYVPIFAGKYPDKAQARFSITMENLAFQFLSGRCTVTTSYSFPTEDTIPSAWAMSADQIQVPYTCPPANAVSPPPPDWGAVEYPPGVAMKSHVFKRSLELDGSCTPLRVFLYQNFPPDEVIVTPNFPSPYSTTVCTKMTWTMEVDPSQKIYLLLNYFDVEDSKDCLYDHVILKDNITGSVIQRVCSINHGIVLQSNTSRLEFTFITSGWNKSNSFNVSYFAMEKRLTEYYPFYAIALIVDPPLYSPDLSQSYGQTLSCTIMKNYDSCVFMSNGRIISRLIMIETSPQVTVLPQAMEIVFQHVQKYKLYDKLKYSKKSCVTWDKNKYYETAGVWVSNVCKLARTDLTSTVCLCSRPGIHAVAAEVKDPQADSLWMYFSWYSGIVVCLVWLLISITTLLKSWSIEHWMEANRQISIFLILVCLGLGTFVLSDKESCKGIFVGMYFSICSVLVWSIMSLSYSLGTFDDYLVDQRNPFVMSFFFSWGLSFIITTSLSGYDSIDVLPGTRCFTKPKNGKRWLYAFPSFFLGLIYLWSCYRARKARRGREYSARGKYLKKVLIKEGSRILVCIIVTWFGLTAMLFPRLFYWQYLFSSCLIIMVITYLYALDHNKIVIHEYKVFDNETTGTNSIITTNPLSE